MPQCVAFDLYDERWRDCWLAATSAARLRKKQVDVDIHQRVARLLEDYGPQSERPLTLRVYGTMIKGFCVINNERARSLSNDCERVVFTFARKPFAEGDNTIRLPAAKRPRMEAALTLDLDLARVEASEAFDWTQAPLEEGALLRLSGAEGLQAEAIPPSLDYFAGPGFAAEAAGLDNPAEAGWLPRLPGEAAFVEMNPEAAVQDPLLLSQLVLPQGQPQTLGADLTADGIPPGGLDGQQPDAVPSFAAEALAVPQYRTRRGVLGKPGVVYGFDNETMLTPEVYGLWQQSAGELSGGRTRPSSHAATMASIPEQAERCGPRLQALLDPADGLSWQVPAMNFMDGGMADGVGLPDVQALLSQAGQEEVPPMGFQHDQGAAGFDAPWDAELQQLGLCQDAGDDAGGAGGNEAQDERTAQVGAILRGCLRNKNTGGVFFEDLVPPGQTDVQTAACTFSALLALASAGEFCVQQGDAYGRILISEVQ